MHCSAECLVSKGCQRDVEVFYYAARYAEKLRCGEIYAGITPRFTLDFLSRTNRGKLLFKTSTLSHT